MAMIRPVTRSLSSDETAAKLRMNGVDDNDNDDTAGNESIVNLFDQVCFSYGDQDAIVVVSGDGGAADEDATCYLELQECSLALAYQLFYRYRPDYVLVDCFGHAVAEAVAVLACLRLAVPFVPVSVADQHAGPGRLRAVVESLEGEVCRRTRRREEGAMIVAVCCCEDDEDPALGVLYGADVHTILYVDSKGNMKEQIRVPSHFPAPGGRREQFQVAAPSSSNESRDGGGNDDMYVMFTSGTSGNAPKAVVGSHRSTFRRLGWFRSTFDASPRVARRTKLTFVDGISELLGTLLHPPSVLVALEPDKLRADGVYALLRNAKPTQITLLPSQLAQLVLLPVQLGDDEDSLLSSLERVVVSGEPFTESLLNRSRAVLPPRCQVLNMYGQTESTGDILCADLVALGDRAVVDSVVAVGTPILQDKIKVSTNGRNEIIVEGNLANGYLGQHRFGRFSTGDVGFCREGIWYVQGRCDDVVKINGILTSPSEVEAAFVKEYNVSYPVAAISYGGHMYLVTEQPAQNFSRSRMKETGLPWHLIPTQVFCHAIPTGQSGAAKIDREKLKTIVLDLLSGTETAESDSPSDLRSIVSQVLGVSSVDAAKSFAELGGDSASAVTLLNQLRSARVPGADGIGAADIMMSDSIKELEDIVTGKRTPKRPKLQYKPAQQTVFVPKQTRHYSRRNVAMRFKACVDASPTLSHDNASFYIGCQGGVLQQISAVNGNSLAHWHFLGWMIQADCLVAKGSVVVCLYKRHTKKGMIVSLSLDLTQTNWTLEVDHRLQTTPVILGNRDLCVPLGGEKLILVDLEKGTERCSVNLPVAVEATPAVNASSTVALYAGESSLQQAYWSSNDSTSSLSVVQLSSESTLDIGPVYKKLLSNPDSSATIACSNGTIRFFPINVSNTAATEGLAIKMSNHPLSSPERLCDQYIVVGSYDGFLRCVDRSAKEVWKVSVGGCIYAKPLALLHGRSCIVCTTAGDVCLVREGKVVERYRIGAEIWSDPVLLDARGTIRIACGARDSSVHIITMSDS